jgi:hypothetical protein
MPSNSTSPCSLLQLLPGLAVRTASLSRALSTAPLLVKASACCLGVLTPATLHKQLGGHLYPLAARGSKRAGVPTANSPGLRPAAPAACTCCLSSGTPYTVDGTGVNPRACGCTQARSHARTMRPPPPYAGRCSRSLPVDTESRTSCVLLEWRPAPMGCMEPRTSHS